MKAATSTVVILYISVILFLLKPVHGKKIGRGYYHREGNGLSFLSHGSNWCRWLQWKSPLDEPVALASFPGSGNSWLRHLLQQSTGYFTGSIYMDYALHANGYAEGVSDGSVLVVKTHDGPPAIEHKYKSALLLIRNPRDALLAEFNRHHAGHLAEASKSAFTKLEPRFQSEYSDWPSYVAHKILEWVNFYRSWLTQFPGPLHVVIYEQLVADTEQVLYGILDFLNINVTNAEMECAMRNQEGIYRRQKHHINFDPFTSKMYTVIGYAQKEVIDLVKQYYIDNQTV